MKRGHRISTLPKLEDVLELYNIGLHRSSYKNLTVKSMLVAMSTIAEA